MSAPIIAGRRSAPSTWIDRVMTRWPRASPNTSSIRSRQPLVCREPACVLFVSDEQASISRGLVRQPRPERAGPPIESKVRNGRIPRLLHGSAGPTAVDRRRASPEGDLPARIRAWRVLWPADMAISRRTDKARSVHLLRPGRPRQLSRNGSEPYNYSLDPLTETMPRL